MGGKTHESSSTTTIQRTAPDRTSSDWRTARSAGRKRYCARSVFLRWRSQKKSLRRQHLSGTEAGGATCSTGRHVALGAPAPAGLPPRSQMGPSAMKTQRDAAYEHHVLETQSARSGSAFEAITTKRTCESERWSRLRPSSLCLGGGAARAERRLRASRALPEAEARAPCDPTPEQLVAWLPAAGPQPPVSAARRSSSTSSAPALPVSASSTSTRGGNHIRH